jgi:hypothetical protein
VAALEPEAARAPAAVSRDAFCAGVDVSASPCCCRKCSVDRVILTTFLAKSRGTSTARAESNTSCRRHWSIKGNVVAVPEVMLAKIGTMSLDQAARAMEPMQRADKQ